MNVNAAPKDKKMNLEFSWLEMNHASMRGRTKKFLFQQTQKVTTNMTLGHNIVMQKLPNYAMLQRKSRISSFFYLVTCLKKHSNLPI